MFPEALALLPVPGPLTSPLSPPLRAAIPRASILSEQGLGAALPCMYLHLHNSQLHMDTACCPTPVALLLTEGVPSTEGVMLHMQTPETTKRKLVRDTLDSRLGQQSAKAEA